MNRYDWLCIAAVAAFCAAMAIIASGPQGGIAAVLSSNVTASWVQAIGGIAAVVAALLVGESQFRVHRAARENDTRDRKRVALKMSLGAATSIHAVLSNAHGEASKMGFPPGAPRAMIIQATAALDILKSVNLSDLPEGKIFDAVLGMHQVGATLIARLEQIEKHALANHRTFERLETVSEANLKSIVNEMGRFDAS